MRATVRRPVSSAAALVVLLGLVWVTTPSALQPAADRTVAIGDIHGDHAAFVSILRTAGLLDANGRWSGGSTVLVQTGDYLDRGADVRKVMDLLRELEASAGRGGGKVHVLMGNHEAMNVLGETRDVNPAAYAAFAGADSNARRDKAFDDYTRLADARAKALGSRPDVYNQRDRAAWMTAHPPGLIEYRAALEPDGEYGRWLRDRPVVVESGGSIFMHAGIEPAGAPGKLNDINRTIAAEIRRLDGARNYMVAQGLILPFFSFSELLAAAQAEAQALMARKTTPPTAQHVEMLNAILGVGKSPLLTSNGPLWFRGFATWTDAEGDALIGPLLSRYSAARFVTGHSIQRDGRIAGRFNNRLFLIDTAMSAVYKGRASALEISGNRITAIYNDSRTVLTPDSGAPSAPSGR